MGSEMENYREIFTQELKAHFGDDQKRICHAVRVLDIAEKIMDGEAINGLERRIITIAALLHDVGIKIAEQKYHSSAGPYQEQEGPPVAREMMKRHHEPEHITERVAYIIGGHHTAAKNDGRDFQIIWEADWFVNIEEEGLQHNEEKVKEMIARNFRTDTGTALVRERYLHQG